MFGGESGARLPAAPHAAAAAEPRPDDGAQLATSSTSAGAPCCATSTPGGGGLPVIVHRGLAAGWSSASATAPGSPVSRPTRPRRSGCCSPPPSRRSPSSGSGRPRRGPARSCSSRCPTRCARRCCGRRTACSSSPPRAADPDPRVRALAEAIRGRRVVRLDARSRSPVVVHPVPAAAVGGRLGRGRRAHPGHLGAAGPLAHRQRVGTELLSARLLSAGRTGGGRGRPRSAGPPTCSGCGPRVSDTCSTSPAACDSISARVTSQGGPSSVGGAVGQHELHRQQLTARREQCADAGDGVVPQWRGGGPAR